VTIPIRFNISQSTYYYEAIDKVTTASPLLRFLIAIESLKPIINKTNMNKPIMVIAVLVAALTSCQNDNSVNPRPLDQIVGPATITGRVKAELNENTPGLENVPAGLTIIAAINTESFVLDRVPNIKYAKKYYYATTNAAGEYTLNVEAGPYGSDVAIFFPVFRKDVIGTTGTYSRVFNGPEVGVSVQKGGNDIHDYDY